MHDIDHRQPTALRWERLSTAAARLGLPPRVLRDEIDAGRASIRTAALGKRGLHFVAAQDVDAYSLALADREVTR